VHDKPRVLKEYMRMHGVQPGWNIPDRQAGGDGRAPQALGFTDIDPAVDKEKSAHLGSFAYGNEKLDRWAACPTTTRPENVSRNTLLAGSKKPPQGLKATPFAANRHILPKGGIIMRTQTLILASFIPSANILLRSIPIRSEPAPSRRRFPGWLDHDRGDQAGPLPSAPCGPEIEFSCKNFLQTVNSNLFDSKATKCPIPIRRRPPYLTI